MCTTTLQGWTTAAALMYAASACATMTGNLGQPVPDPGPPLPAPAEAAPDRAGLLLMAHGGGPEWDGRVEAAIAGLRDHIPVSVAFGMADPHTLQSSLDELHDHGVSAVAVVRLFVSGASFLHPTEYLFGLRGDAPARAMIGHRMVAGEELAPLHTDAHILLDREGLVDSDEAPRILAERVNAHAGVPAETGVLVIAHGMGAEDENQDLLFGMEDAAVALRSHGYAEVRVATLREDWAPARETAERDIRATVERMGKAHASVLVVPFRVSGFGPYAEVLAGLDYEPTDGLLPHPLVTDWIARRVTMRLCAAGLQSPLGPCSNTPSSLESDDEGIGTRTAQGGTEGSS